MYILDIWSSVLIDKKPQRDLMMPNPLRTLEIVSFICDAKESFESSVKPKCLWLFTVFISMSLKYISGWSCCLDLREKTTCTTYLLGSWLKLIFHWYAHWEFRPRSWCNSIAEIFGSLMIENRDVSFAKNLTWDLIPSSKSLM